MIIHCVGLSPGSPTQTVSVKKVNKQDFLQVFQGCGIGMMEENNDYYYLPVADTSRD